MATRNQLRLESGIGDRQPLPADWLEHLGCFRFYFDDDRWSWSPQIEQMHGYKPGTTAPSTLLLLSHVHLDDYQQVAAALYDVRRTHQPFSSRHRIVDIRDQVHDVVMIGAPFHDTRGAIVGMQGFYLDLTQAAALARHRRNEHPADHLRVVAAGKGHGENRRQRVRGATHC